MTMEAKVDSAVHSEPQIRANKSSRDSLDKNGTSNSFPEITKLPAMAFTIDLGAGRIMDKSRLQHLARQSQARHQRVHSMSAAPRRAADLGSLASHRPLSAKLPRKTQGYTSEGYFSSDQEDSLLSAMVQLRQSPSAQQRDFKNKILTSSPILDRNHQSLHFQTGKSKSPMVDSIMSRSDSFPSRQGLDLPLENVTHADQTINSLFSLSYNSPQLTSILDQSPDGLMLIDNISSPDLDLMTPELTPSSPEHSSHIEMSDIFRKCILKNELQIVEDDSRSDSSTGTYTIEADYSEEQKARMSIDRTFEVDPLIESVSDRLQHHFKSKETDTQLMMGCDQSPKRNILEINCSYEPEQAAQRQIKSTCNYLEKIKKRVRTISEKTFQKTPKPSQDEGCFTSVTACGVLAKVESIKPHHQSLSRCQADKTDYVHHLIRESSTPVCLPSHERVELSFESSVLRSAHARLFDDSGIEDSSDHIVGKLSNLSLNRCRGDQTWIKDWADSVKTYNDTVNEINSSFSFGNPHSTSPRQQKSRMQARPPTKIPSPLATRYNTTTTQNGETSSHLTRTQAAVGNLEVAVGPLHLTRSNSLNYRLKRKDGGSPLRVVTGRSAGARPPLGAYTRSFDNDNSEPPSPQRRRALASQPTSPLHRLTLESVLGNKAARAPPPAHPAPVVRRSSSFNAVNNNYLDISDDSDARLRPAAPAAPTAVRYNRATQLRRDRLQRNNNRPSLSSTRDTYRSDRGAVGSARKRAGCEETRAATSSPCHSSPVHRSQSFHSSNVLESPHYSSDEDQMETIRPERGGEMATSTHSDILRPTLDHTFNMPMMSHRHRRESDKRKTFIVDERRRHDSLRPDTARRCATHASTRHSRDGDKYERKRSSEEEERKTFVLDSDTNSTTNGSSPRNSSVFSHEQMSATTGASDTDAPPPHRKQRTNPSAAQHRHSGDFSSRGARGGRGEVQPRYLDISRYRSDAGDARPAAARHDGGAGSARRIEMQQKKAELEKWKRRASYDPRKSAAAAKHKPPATHANSSVLRSQSFHGAMSAGGAAGVRHSAPHHRIDYTSDDDF